MNKTDAIAHINATVIVQLEAVMEGRATALPWTRPWKTGASMPFNGATKRPYHGTNIIILWLSGFDDPRWYTYNQAMDLGMPVRKGQKGTKVLFWRFIEKERVDGGIDKIPLVREYTVFNYAQLSVDEKATAAEILEQPKTHAPELELLARVETLSLSGGLEHGFDKAAYDPISDAITMPAKASFTSEAAYAATLAHEAVHATGAEKRLKREFGKRFGDLAYAQEELVAEIGAAMTCAMLGVQGQLQHVEYLAHWVQVLKNDRFALVTAAREAEKAARLLMEGAEEEEKELDEAAAA